ncbi:MAG: MBL fold metallo-hydrolase [Arcobacter sp.]|nr:MAG: MBL fold metallo-hydrolase [Arcobacter sp.]
MLHLNKKIFIVLFLFISGFVLATEPVWDANKVILKSEKITSGVYAYYPTNAKELEKKGLAVATSGGFIIGNKGIFLIETMINKRLHKQVQQLIKEASNKRVLYAVNTSFHGDHSYGNMYLNKNTIIIQHQNAKNYIAKHFENDKKFMINTFGKNRGIEEIVPTLPDILIQENSSMSIDLGNRIVEIIDFGFAQTGGDLFIWLPDSKVLWTGNPIITFKPSVPWLLDGHLVETLSSLKKVYAFLPKDAKIIPGHGSIMQKEDLKWHINYLQTIKDEVSKAIKEGLSLEETVKKVSMEEFKGYALFGWVHPKLNIPAAYKDLKKK